MTIRNKIGFWLGLPVFFIILVMPFPESLPAEGQRTLAVAILMALWWITEAIPISVTALIPVVAFPVLKIMPAQSVVSSYGDSNIFLFMGGFLIAITMQRWELHRRMALHIVRAIGGSPQRLVLGFMIATAVLSMWISNTATTMMMYPIGLAVIVQMSSFFDDNGDEPVSNFKVTLMLGIAYAASIGGIGTLIGTPPNIVFASAVKSIFPNAPEIGFLQWMTVGLPLVIVFIPITWVFLTRIIFKLKVNTAGFGKTTIQKQLSELGDMTRAEGLTLFVFILTALGWIFRKNINLGFLTIPGWSHVFGIESYVNDATVAIFASVLLFLIPVNFREKKFLLNWEWAVRIPWGVLILFGGGIALATGFKESGLAHWIGSQLHLFSTVPLFLMILIIAAMLIFLTEMTSNTATSTIFMPILAAIAISIRIHPFLLMVPATIAASCAFMLPVATPPNAIIFGSGNVTMPQMAKAGFGLNIIGIFLITLIIYLIAIPAFGIILGDLPTWIN